MFSRLRENSYQYDLDRRITRFFYKILESHPTYWPSGVVTYRLPWPHEMTPKEKKEVAGLCDEWNRFVSKLTGIEVPIKIPKVSEPSEVRVVGRWGTTTISLKKKSEYG